MESKVLTWNDANEAIKAVKDGEVVAFPTETVYGLGAIASSKEAFDKLCAVKRRPADKPFTLMVATYTDIARFAELDKDTIELIHAFMPGQVTFLLKARKGIPHHVDLGTGVIGVRMPAHEKLLSFIEKVDEPLLVPSANVSNNPPCKDEKALLESFNGSIPYIIGEGEVNGKPSTIVDLSVKGQIKLVREGSVPFALLKEAFESPREVKLTVASDHGGFAYKEAAKKHLEDMGYKVLDFGTYSEASCDYPLFAQDACKAIVNGEAELGFNVCTSGEGICMAANKIKDIRCGLGYDDVASGKTREHNHANMLAFGQKYMKLEDVLRRIDIFLVEKPSPLEKHIRRVNELE